MKVTGRCHCGEVTYHAEVDENKVINCPLTAKLSRVRLFVRLWCLCQVGLPLQVLSQKSI